MELVSVVVITYNSADFIIETLNSIRSQTYSNIELIVSDDASTDNTVRICSEWMNDNRSRFLRAIIITVEKNTGIPANLNRGIKECRGNWIKGTAGDDLLFPNAIENLMNYVQANDDYEIFMLHGRMVEFDDSRIEREIIGKYGTPLSQRFNEQDVTAQEQFEILLRFCPISAPTTFFRRDIFNKVGYFIEEYKFWEDRPMWLNVTSKGIKIYFVNEFVAKYRKHQKSIQINRNNTFFSKTAISMQLASKEIIYPHLPVLERYAKLYIYWVNRMFVVVYRNRKNFFRNFFYKSLVLIPNVLIKNLTKKYLP